MPCRHKLASVINLFPSFTATVRRFVLLPKSGEGYPFQQTNSTACMVWKILSITSLCICKQTRIYYYQHSRSLACFLLIFITKDHQNTSFLWRTIRIWCFRRHDRENEETLTAIIITICLRFGILSHSKFWITGNDKIPTKFIDIRC